MKDDRLYLVHILECIDRTERYTAEARSNFWPMREPRTVLRNLQVLSESTQRLSADPESGALYSAQPRLRPSCRLIC